ncbi:MAG: hypothetical protein A3H72_02505 [Candidatus Doudnabacteria bacterium RIFCSPLOWO2_02_FULL_48_8]|uniref:Uncharacterized protein n=1 Tax=Candidatus Doudnabacteria bacterium RIFCSPHIGHO2_01_FULL_46_24 TaxID=1817825 RepID=A0A1F5NW52_9BACT|nr:MAG: hypothetical protein A2720_01870 [Candidatus Doudnabacteria bacterium RIFCSPHIGHO2_01_FULL_46_24]OGE95169.1 MAG: hypothetical protein A3H72_02505 [Candidatus Doudnabacteria bacterium RIFCSPLOWO2_02_FULL_48_8]OGE95374.1 MAG: hypothetical protein A3E98_00850 [Candidatus Doudnabacteria bacterium RIFCSPHIGHO2_12_FULL_48_11]
MSLNLVIQGFIAVILVGIFYNVWVSTRVYGGIIGRAVRFLGIGMLFITIAVIEKILLNFALLQATPNLSLAQDVLTLLGLFFLAMGFSKLASVAK